MANFFDQFDAAPATPQGAPPAPAGGNFFDQFDAPAEPAAAAAELPRGIRNNNPGNIVKTATAWAGEVQGTDPRFKTFATIDDGVRALQSNLLAYQDKHGLNTVEGIISRWAPSSENNTAAYVSSVAQQVGVDPRAPLDLRDPQTMQRMTDAIIRHENGRGLPSAGPAPVRQAQAAMPAPVQAPARALPMGAIVPPTITAGGTVPGPLSAPGAMEAAIRMGRSSAGTSNEELMALYGMAPRAAPPAPPAPEMGMGEAAVRGLTHGALNLVEGAGTVAQWAGNRLGMPALAGAGKAVAEAMGERAKAYEPPPELQGAIMDNPVLLAKGAWWAYNLADTLPSFAASIVPGLGAAKTIQVAGRAVQLTPQVVQRLAVLGGSLTGGAAGGSLEGAQTYQTVLERGGSEQEASAAFVAMSLASGALNALSGASILSPQMKSRAMNFLVSGAVEGTTELAEEPAEGAILSRTSVARPEDDPLSRTAQGLNVFPVAAVLGGGAAAARRPAPVSSQPQQPPAPTGAPAGEAPDGAIPLRDLLGSGPAQPAPQTPMPAAGNASMPPATPQPAPISASADTLPVQQQEMFDAPSVAPAGDQGPGAIPAGGPGDALAAAERPGGPGELGAAAGASAPGGAPAVAVGDAGQSDAALTTAQTGAISEIGKIGKAITENLYGQLFDALKAGKTKMAGIKDPVLTRARPAFEAGLITSPEDLQRFENEGYPELPATPAPEPPAKPANIAPQKPIYADYLTQRGLSMRDVAGFEQAAKDRLRADYQAWDGASDPGEYVPDPEQRPATPVAESQALPQEGSDAGVAPGQGSVAPAPKQAPQAAAPQLEAQPQPKTTKEPTDGQGKQALQEAGQGQDAPRQDARVLSEPAAAQPEKEAAPGANLEALRETLRQKYESPVDRLAHEAASSPRNDKREPSAPQIEAGNAPLGHPRVGGLDISIENPEGSVREDKDNTPPKWRTTMRAHYGYVKGVVARAPDKDHVDVFVKPGTREDYSGSVFVVDQNKGNGQFDEPKVMIGWSSQGAATVAYLRHYNRGWGKRIRAVTRMDWQQFRDKLGDPDGFSRPQTATTSTEKPDQTRPVDTVPASSQVDRSQLADRTASSPKPSLPELDSATAATAPMTVAEKDRIEDTSSSQATTSDTPQTSTAEHATTIEPEKADIPSIEGKTIEEKVLVEDTQEVVTVRRPATEAIADVDRRIAALKAVLACLTR